MPCKFLNQVKFFELTLDNFGMLQCTEWEPNGQGVNYSQERFLILHCHLTHVKLSCIVHPSLMFWRFWPLCLMSSLLMEFFYSTYLLQDVHHGNGTQEIYKQNKTVLNVSLHRHEGGKFYPGTGTGAVHEFGSMGGEGYYVNIPWSWGGVRDNDYIFAFEHIVLPIAREFAHDFTIISAGFDVARGDPLGCCDVSLIFLFL
ncbi:putative histone deacetylase [Helianthus annuus]|nr:putative histone deacetylase [Helianthus annuus]KAJ0900709.1 putative histone deacetylase [Helianthus annuus]